VKERGSGRRKPTCLAGALWRAWCTADATLFVHSRGTKRIDVERHGLALAEGHVGGRGRPGRDDDAVELLRSAVVPEGRLRDSGSARGERRRIREDRIGEDYEQPSGIVLVADLDGDPELTGKGLGGAQLGGVGSGRVAGHVIVAAARERRSGALRRIIWVGFSERRTHGSPGPASTPGLNDG
jgi:hypothetical protein